MRTIAARPPSGNPGAASVSCPLASPHSHAIGGPDARQRRPGGRQWRQASIMELICPSCNTRYLVPDDAVTEAGRQVSCTECHHGWQAFPPLIPNTDSLEGAPQTQVTAENSGFGTAPAAGRSAAHDAPRAPEMTFPTVDTDAAFADSAGTAAEPREALVPGTQSRGTGPQEIPTGSEAASSRPAPEASAASNPIRQQQLNEIRKMLAEVQSGHRKAGGSATGDPDAALSPTEGTAEEAGAGKDRVAASAEARPDGSGAPLDAKDPRKPQETTPRQADAEPGASDRGRRTAEQQADPDPAEGDPDYVAPPGFLRTGLLVVVLIAAAMTTLYLLQPQITSRLPSTGPALTKYIEMIDKLRAHIASDYEWVKGKIAGEDPPPADPSPGDQNPASTSAEPGGSSDAENGRRAAEIGSAAKRQGQTVSSTE